MLDTPKVSLNDGDVPPLPGEPHGDGLPRTFRPDIEGVRALAVLLVVLYHGHLLHITGGYIGVDIFFVLSGFLITRQLVHGVDKRGVHELPSFYARRIKRLLPASATVTVSTIVAGYFFLPALQAKTVTVDAMFTTFYGLNYRLAAEGVSYLHQDAAVSPLQHFWSLGVEEQFYLAWPLMIVACLLLPLRARYPALLVMLSTVLVGSFYLSATTTAANPSWAYFGLQTRAWELAAGGLIALSAPLWTRLPPLASNLAAWAAFATLLVSAWVLNDSTLYPGVMAAVPVGCTAVILAAGCAPRHHSIERLLSEPVIQGIGKVSYSWYLWHWPMLVIFPYIAGESLAWPRRLEVICLSLLAAILSYHLVENPVRHRNRLNFEWMRLGVALAAVVIAVAVIVSSSVNTTGTGVAASTITLDVTTPTAVSAKLTKVLADSLKIEKVPRNLTPNLPNAATDLSPNYHNGCHADFKDAVVPNPNCVSGDVTGKHTMVIFGDSHIEQFYGGLDVDALKKHWRLITWTRSACPAASVSVYTPVLKRTYTECDTWRTNTIEAIIRMHPDLVLVGESDNAPGDSMPAGKYARGITVTLSALAQAKIPVTFMLDTPFPAYDIPNCVANHLRNVGKCDFSISHAYTYPQRRVAANQAARQAGAKVVNPAGWLCAKFCPVVVGNILVWRDNGHMTNTYSRWLAPAMSSLFPRTSTHTTARRPDA